MGEYPCGDCVQLRLISGGGPPYPVCPDCWNTSAASEVKARAWARRWKALARKYRNTFIEWHLTLLGPYDDLLEDARASRAEVERLQQENMCDACAGTGKPTSERPCMCGGTGKMSDAACYLREQFVAARIEVNQTRDIYRRIADAELAEARASRAEVERLRAALASVRKTAHHTPHCDRDTCTDWCPVDIARRALAATREPTP